MTRREILDALNHIRLGQCAWEGGEDVMTFDGRPIGGTVGGRLEIERWWPALKFEIAKRLSQQQTEMTHG